MKYVHGDLVLEGRVLPAKSVPFGLQAFAVLTPKGNISIARLK